jgi:hypothetical protein
MITTTPRDLFSKHQTVRSLRQQPIPDNNLNDDIDLTAIIAALSQTHAQTCYLCSAQDHKMVSCPTYQRLRDNPRAVSAILRGLKSKQDPSKHRSSGPPRHIRQICDSEDTIPNGTGEGTIIDLEAGEGYSINDDDSSTTIHVNIDTLDQNFQ